MSEKKKISSSHERLWSGYLRPGVHDKLLEYVKQTGSSKSEALNEAAKLLVSKIETKGKEK